MKVLIGAFFSAVLLFNAVPHLVQGICGKRHMTPFSVKSHAVTNVLWGWANLVAGVAIAQVVHWRTWDLAPWLAFCAGGLSVSLYLAAFWSKPDARLPWHKG